MAYSNSASNNARLLRRTITGLFDFAGRSRRTEVGYFWIATALLSVVMNFGIAAIVSIDVSQPAITVLSFLIQLPVFALFVRRLHDQDRSGWWGLTLPLAYLFNSQHIIAKARGDIAGIVAAQEHPAFLLVSFALS